jgi:hypothetical protein
VLLDKRTTELSTRIGEFGADDLACALVLCQRLTPTRDELAQALRELYPAGNGPTVTEVLAAGWLVPTVDGKRLREPPLSPAELWDNLTHPLRSPSASNKQPERRLAAFHSTLAVATTCPASPAATPLFSYFTGPITNTLPRAAITIAQLYEVVTKPPVNLRKRAEAARIEYEANGKTTHYTELKTCLDYFSVGGIFTRRADAALQTESGLLTLDFDKLGGRVAEARTQLLSDAALAPALALVFTSPSGDGLKAILAADPRYDRRTNYERLARHLTRRYGWGPTLDAKTAEVSRACFLSHDADAWIATAYAASVDVVQQNGQLISSQ